MENAAYLRKYENTGFRFSVLYDGTVQLNPVLLCGSPFSVTLMGLLQQQQKVGGFWLIVHFEAPKGSFSPRETCKREQLKNRLQGV